MGNVTLCQDSAIVTSDSLQLIHNRESFYLSAATVYPADKSVSHFLVVLGCSIRKIIIVISVVMLFE